MEQDFAFVARWIEQHDPEPRHQPQFNPPASDEEIAKAESGIGFTFPASMRELYRLTDGQPFSAASLEGSFTLLPLAEVVDAARFLNGEFPDETNVHDPDHAPMDVDRGIRPVWWSRRWIPVMANGGGDYLCLDLDPAEGGTAGQLITYYHDETFRRCVASGMDVLLARLATQLASGRCRIEDGMIEDR